MKLIDDYFAIRGLVYSHFGIGDDWADAGHK